MMKRLTIAAFVLLCGTTIIRGQDTIPWYVDRWDFHRPSPKARNLPLVSVEGKHFVTADGSAILFRGIAISDPDKIGNQGHWDKQLFENVKELGANIVRIPIHPVAWRERTPGAYLEMLEDAVDWCTDLELYIILDWHTIGNLEMEMFQNPMYNTSKAETFDFWRKIAARFAGNNTVAFYELFNEPTIYRGQLGECSWPEWKALVEKMITVIRYADKETIPIVSGFDWAYDLTPLHREPINAENIAYSVHPYSNKSPQPWAATWEQNFGFAANTWPVFATEFSYDVRDVPALVDPEKGFVEGNFKLRDPEKGVVRGNLVMVKGEPIDYEGDHYGNQIISYLEGKDISWCIWVYDPDWGGAKIKSWKYEPTEGLRFFSEAMKGNLPVQKERK